MGVDRKLYVAAAGVDPNLPQNRNRCITHQLVFLIGQRLGRRNGDRVPGVDAHRVQIFNRADDNAVVSSVANDLHFELFPANQAFFDQELAGGREIKTAAANLEKLFKVISYTTARATERKTRPDDGWITQRLLNRLRLLEAMRNA